MKAREPRKRVATQARMRTNAGWSDVVIRDISSRGLGLRSSRAPARGDYIELGRQQHRLVGRVVWSDGECFGVVLSDAIAVDEVLSSTPAPRRGSEDRRLRPRHRESLRDLQDQRFAVISLAENSRYLSRMMNFVAVAAIACMGAALAAELAGSVLSHTMYAVSAGLDSNHAVTSAG